MTGRNVEQKTHKVFLALGTNLGDRLNHLEEAQKRLSPGVSILSASPVYETPPWGYSYQPAFLNQVLEVETELAPLDLLDYVKDIEKQLGRVRSFRNGPRLIDIDILFYDDLLLKEHGLAIPHPRLHERAFVLVPLHDIAPNLRHPNFGKTVREMLEEVDRVGIELVDMKGAASEE